MFLTAVHEGNIRVINEVKRLLILCAMEWFSRGFKIVAVMIVFANIRVRRDEIVH